jgi:hypothetical protein
METTSFSIDLPVRSYRRPMKPVLSRKISSSARINMNKFWNDLEEFYDRFADPSAVRSAVEALPEYTSDVDNQDRESAENDLNERLEHSFTSESDFDDDVDSGNEDCDLVSVYSSTESISGCGRESGLVRPPRTLLPLFKKTWKKLMAF